MPLAYEVTQPLMIPADAWNADDIATILVTGGRYGGQWALRALIVADGKPAEACVGEIFTAADNRPSMAVDTALIWVNDTCAKTGVRLAGFNNLNHTYDAGSAPYLASALFYIDRQEQS